MVSLKRNSSWRSDLMLGLLALLIGGSTAAQTICPEIPIRMDIGFPPGSSDTGARLLEAPRPSSSFAQAYQEWKVGHGMSTFELEQDADVLAAVAAGDCAYANGAIFQYGRVNLPGARDYGDEQVMAYGETVDKLVDACQRDKVAGTARIN